MPGKPERTIETGCAQWAPLFEREIMEQRAAVAAAAVSGER